MHLEMHTCKNTFTKACAFTKETKKNNPKQNLGQPLHTL
jgi:hypothetical protein